MGAFNFLPAEPALAEGDCWETCAKACGAYVPAGFKLCSDLCRGSQCSDEVKNKKVPFKDFDSFYGESIKLSNGILSGLSSRGPLSASGSPSESGRGVIRLRCCKPWRRVA